MGSAGENGDGGLFRVEVFFRNGFGEKDSLLCGLLTRWGSFQTEQVPGCDVAVYCAQTQCLKEV